MFPQCSPSVLHCLCQPYAKLQRPGQCLVQIHRLALAGPHYLPRPVCLGSVHSHIHTAPAGILAYLLLTGRLPFVSGEGLYDKKQVRLRGAVVSSWPVCIHIEGSEQGKEGHIALRAQRAGRPLAAVASSSQQGVCPP